MEVHPLKYGMNPHQKEAFLTVEGKLPFCVLNGNPGYINFLDAMNGWALVRELDEALGLPAAASFKHVSPSGAAVGVPLDDRETRMYFAGRKALSPLATAYVRARGTDRMSSFGDFAALSRPCDRETAEILVHEVSDGIIAPGYAPEALGLLKRKRKGGYAVIEMDSDYVPADLEQRQVYGVTFVQQRNSRKLTQGDLDKVVTKKKVFPPEARRDLLLSLITLKYTQSNSVCYASHGQTVGVGAGQQSRIHCTRLAGGKADFWHLRQSDKVLSLPFLPEVARPDRDNAIDEYLSSPTPVFLRDGTWRRLFSRCPDPLTEEEKRAFIRTVSGVSLGSDAFFPFDDNIRRAYASGVSYLAEPGGSVRDAQVIECCDALGLTMAFTNVRLFHH